MRRLPIRVRLALAFAPVMAAVVAAMGAFVYLSLERSLDRSVDRDLAAQLDETARRVQRGDEEPAGADPDSLALVEVLSADGRLVSSRETGLPPFLTPAQAGAVAAGRPLVREGRIAGLHGEWRLRALGLEPVGGGGRVVAVAARSLASRDEALHHLLGELLVAGGVGLALSLLAGFALARGALRPVEEMRARAEEISADIAGRRLPVSPARDEVARLGATLNAMLDRIEVAREHEQRFVADASHELRTPLALLKTELELALRRPRGAAELEASLRSAAEETDRLVQLAEDMLFVARADHGRLPIRPETVDLAAAVDAVAQRFAAWAEQAGRRIVVGVEPGLEVTADRARLEQALGNLVDNALEHGSGEVRIDAHARDGGVELAVSDQGVGFAPGFADRAFDRFSRADEARTAGGSGLGLAIVELVARAHGGSAGIGPGARVWLRVPSRQPAGHS